MLDVLDDLDGYSELRNGLRRIADARDDWAGIPMPIEGQDLIIEPNFPNAEKLAAIANRKHEPLEPGVRFINRWRSLRHHHEVYVWEEGGRRRGAAIPLATSRVGMEINTLGCSVAWGIEQESKAIRLLADLVSHAQFKHYLLTGMFLETSKRSGVTYLFRKLRPTVAMNARPGAGDKIRVLCALCMHPIAYYGDTWAGAMTPTDDVIAHLMLMRGDEHAFWNRANQHPPGSPEAAL